MQREDMEQVKAIVREIAKEEIKLAFGDATPLAKQMAKDAAAEIIKEAKEAAEEAKAAAKEAKEAAKAEKAKK
jgi:hypothetical protein